MMNIWTKPGQITDIPKAGETIKHDSRWIDNASFVRLKNLQLSYTLPAAMAKKTGILNGMKVYVTGRNLVTFTGYKGIDPEVDYETASGDYPNTKQIIAGVEFTF